MQRATSALLLGIVLYACATNPPEVSKVAGFYRSRELPGHAELVLYLDASFLYEFCGDLGSIGTTEGIWHPSPAGVELTPQSDSGSIPKEFLRLHILTHDGELYLSPERPLPWSRPNPYVDLRRVADTSSRQFTRCNAD